MNGILLLDKPLQCTSFEAVRAVSRVFDRAKAGHSGTLDPAASGVLPVFLERATKLIPLLPDTDKEYTARVCLGSATDTGDAEGTVTAVTSVLPTEQQLRAVLPSFTGDLLQVPPMYSAKKQNGVPLYKLARNGETAHREACPVTVERLELSDFDGSSFTLSVHCSSGTYIRTLAEDIAAAAGSLAHLTALRRTMASGIPVSRCVSLDRLREAKENGTAQDLLCDPSVFFPDLPRLSLRGDLQRLFLNGFRFPAVRAGVSQAPGTRLWVETEEGIRAIAEIGENGDLLKLWQDSVL